MTTTHQVIWRIVSISLIVLIFSLGANAENILDDYIKKGMDLMQQENYSEAIGEVYMTRGQFEAD